MLPDIDVQVIVEASVSPSEDPVKVAIAASKVSGIPAADLIVGESALRGEGMGISLLEGLRDQLRDRHVRGAARRRLLVAANGKVSTLMFNRQAAAIGVIAVCGDPGESPLGPVYLTLRSKKLDALIDWLTAYEPG